MEIIPPYRMTKQNIEDLLALHDSYPDESIESLLEVLEIEPDYSMYGT